MTMVGCSDSTSLSTDSTLAPLRTEAATTSTTIAVSTTVVVGTTTVGGTVTSTVPGPAATMTPPTLNPGSTTPPTLAPETTTGTSPDTPAPPATTSPSVCDSCRSDYVFPYTSFFDVPQLGSEPVRGSGCGANSTIGDVVPDGIWDGHINVGSKTLQIDLQCVYYGASAAPYVARCEQSADASTCLEYGDQFWIVNNNTRKRTIPLDPSFRHRYATAEGCADPGPGQGLSSSSGADAMDSWIVIVGGTVTFALTSCVYG